MGWFKNNNKNEDEVAHNNLLDNISEEIKETKAREILRKSKEEKLKLLEIASNCAMPGEPSSRTIERAVAFKKYLLS